MDLHVTDGAAAAATDRTLAITRRLPAPPAEVFAAWTDPAQLKQWWGPQGMTTPSAEVDLRPGGFHRAVMRDASGQEYPCDTRIDAVEAPHRLVVSVPASAGGPLVGAEASIAFLPEGEGTRLEVLWRHPTAEMRATHEAMGFAPGWGSMLDKLTAHLVKSMEGCPFGAPATIEHGWLHRMLGEWSYACEGQGPEGPVHGSGIERVRSLGGYWVVGEAEGTMPGIDRPTRWIVTLGVDSRTRRVTGTWVGSMMGHLSVYDGALSEDGRVLTLESDGPAFGGEGTARYRDVVELDGNDRRTLVCLVQGEDGGWTEMMRSAFRRIA